MVFFETERLRLRNVRPDDADVMFEYRNEERCARYQRGQTRSRDGIGALVRQRGEDTVSAEAPCLIAVALRETDEMIGEIVVMPNEKTFSMGYTVSGKHHRRGYAFEALSVLTQYLHEAFGDWEFICFTDPENRAGMGLLKKLGYRDLGYLPSRDSRVFGKWITRETEAELAQLTK